MDNIRKIILQDQGFMGDVARGVTNGLSYDKIAENASHKTTMMTFVWLKVIRTLTGKIPYDSLKPPVKKNVYHKAKQYVQSSTLTTAEREHLQTIVDTWNHENNVTPEPTVQQKPEPDTTQRVKPEPQTESKTARKPGVYVYSYNLYLENPVSFEDKRTLFKVGASEYNVESRIATQQNKTPVPDDMTVLRVFECSDAIKEEKKFHRLLTAAGHAHDTNTGGTEWFLTWLEFIDAIGESLGLINTHVE